MSDDDFVARLTEKTPVSAPISRPVRTCSANATIRNNWIILLQIGVANVSLTDFETGSAPTFNKLPVEASGGSLFHIQRMNDPVKGRLPDRSASIASASAKQKKDRSRKALEGALNDPRGRNE
ncbi:hypothetical protein [uncultured Roseibium sp.]|uniref:hypothetical protein n=1 Tax=uncultured Roseibium sp. TaxID=1936171 RepID=UPI002639247B|nr:hypothetical protein [uncultured Roseibium sp.]